MTIMAFRRDITTLLVVAGLLFMAGCAETRHHVASGSRITLGGAEEVPPVVTTASGSGTITVGSDRSVSGSITTSGVAGLAAHIHEGARGTNGPVIVPLIKSTDNVWSVPPGASLTDSQYASYKAGNLYVNVHSAANKGGEIRGQLRP